MSMKSLHLKSMNDPIDITDMNELKKYYIELDNEVKLMGTQTHNKQFSEYYQGIIDYVPNSNVLNEIKSRYKISDEKSSSLGNNLNRKLNLIKAVYTEVKVTNVLKKDEKLISETKIEPSANEILGSKKPSLAQPSIIKNYLSAEAKDDAGYFRKKAKSILEMGNKQADMYINTVNFLDHYVNDVKYDKYKKHQMLMKQDLNDQIDKKNKIKFNTPQIKNKFVKHGIQQKVDIVNQKYLISSSPNSLKLINNSNLNQDSIINDNRSTNYDEDILNSNKKYDFSSNNKFSLTLTPEKNQNPSVKDYLSKKLWNNMKKTGIMPKSNSVQTLAKIDDFDKFKNSLVDKYRLERRMGVKLEQMMKDNTLYKEFSEIFKKNLDEMNKKNVFDEKQNYVRAFAKTEIEYEERLKQVEMKTPSYKKHIEDEFYDCYREHSKDYGFDKYLNGNLEREYKIEKNNMKVLQPERLYFEDSPWLQLKMDKIKKDDEINQLRKYLSQEEINNLRI